MNPFDTMNSDTQKNSSNNLKSTTSQESATTTQKASQKNGPKTKSKIKRVAKHNKRSTGTAHKDKTSNKLGDFNQLLNNKYSTARLSANDVIRLKILQSITGYKSRSNLVDKMIKIVKPVFLKSASDKKRYDSLYKYAIMGLKIKNKFK